MIRTAFCLFALGGLYADLEDALKKSIDVVTTGSLKYNKDDYDGALDDFDHAIALEPYNTVALFNRGLLETEVSDYDKARAGTVYLQRSLKTAAHGQGGRRPAVEPPGSGAGRAPGERGAGE